MKRLEGKAAIVTGAGTGIGQAIAHGYAKEGADIIIVYSSSRGGAEETQKLVEQEGRKGVLVQCDQSKPEDITRMVKEAHEAFGHIDVVVNNATARDAAPLFDYTVELWDHCINTNLRAMFLIMKEVAPIMIKQGKGHIINVTSNMGMRPSLKPRAAYGSTKAGIIALTASAAEELGPYGIYVNALAPGTIATNIGGLAAQVTSDIVKRRIANIPLRRRGVPEDMVGPAIFLASEDCAYVDGITLLADGGWANAD